MRPEKLFMLFVMVRNQGPRGTQGSNDGSFTYSYHGIASSSFVGSERILKLEWPLRLSPLRPLRGKQIRKMSGSSRCCPMKTRHLTCTSVAWRKHKQIPWYSHGTFQESMELHKFILRFSPPISHTHPLKCPCTLSLFFSLSFSLSPYLCAEYSQGWTRARIDAESPCPMDASPSEGLFG